MTRLVQFAMLLLAQSTVPREVIQLARIKQDMSVILAKMPDYTCMEVVERSIREKGARQAQVKDKLRLDVAFVGGKEVFGRHGNGQMNKNQPSNFIGSGLTSSGEFAGHARSVFLKMATTMRYAGPETLQGRAALRWDYATPLMFSGWTLQYAGVITKVAARGSFWVDASTLELLQLDVDATEVEPRFPISAVHVSIRYGRVQLGTTLALIPQSTEVLETDRDGTWDRNATQFSQCREYGAEAAISFDSEPAVKK